MNLKLIQLKFVAVSHNSLYNIRYFEIRAQAMWREFEEHILYKHQKVFSPKGVRVPKVKG